MVQSLGPPRGIAAPYFMRGTLKVRDACIGIEKTKSIIEPYSVVDSAHACFDSRNNACVGRINLIVRADEIEVHHPTEVVGDYQLDTNPHARGNTEMTIGS